MFEGRPSTHVWMMLPKVPQTNPFESQWWFWANYYIFLKNPAQRLFGEDSLKNHYHFLVFLIGGWTGCYNLPRWSCWPFGQNLRRFLLKHRSTLRSWQSVRASKQVATWYPYDIWRILRVGKQQQLLHEEGDGLLKGAAMIFQWGDSITNPNQCTEKIQGNPSKWPCSNASSFITTNMG